MTEIGVRIALRSPTLLASAPPASNQLETLRFIPGNTLRGVIARRYLDLGNSPEGEEFRRLFLGGEVRFGFGFAAGSEVLPLSARSCKYDAGFRAEGGHGVVDLLLPRTEGAGCAQCPSPIDYYQEFWSAQDRKAVGVSTRLLTRTAIDPQRGTAKNGQLYSQRVLAEGQTFLATIEAPEDLALRLADLLAEEYPAVLGAGSSRGQGWADVGRHDPSPVDHGTAKARYETFREVSEKAVLAVTLWSDGLFRDDYLREATAPALRDLEPLGIRADDWEPRLTRAFMDVRQVFGFDGVPIRLPRPPRIAVAAGSAFLFEAKEGRDPVIPEGDGTGWIGESNGEGYGRAVLWHAFHLDPEGGRP